jgi:membrane-associated phospholipid phosphatase
LFLYIIHKCFKYFAALRSSGVPMGREPFLIPLLEDTSHSKQANNMQTRSKRICILLVTTLARAFAAHADIVTDWNEVALRAIKTDQTPPPLASRALAILHTAIYDAVNGITRSHEPYLVSDEPWGEASVEAAALAAGHFVLVQLYPAQQATFDAVYHNGLGATDDTPTQRAGIAWGESVANAILAVRANDGSAEVAAYVPGSRPGDWQPTPPAFAPALLPQWPRVKPWAMTSGSQFRPPGPPALASASYVLDFNLTKQFGSKDSRSRTAEQTASVFFWADGAGTVTPPGHWNVIAREVAAQWGNTMEQNARLFALLNIAEADAAILAWDCKYAYSFWRPITAIHAAARDGNSATNPDPAWTPLLVTPPFPEYISGHSTFSGAAATVLRVFFGADRIRFVTTSEDLPGVSRSYNSFWDAALEAGLSRILGGIHFMSANLQGLRCGARLGTYVMDHFLEERRVAPIGNTGAHSGPRNVKP